MSGGTRQLWRIVGDLGAEYGYELVTSRRGHAKLVAPGRRSIPVPSSPRSNHGAVLSIRALLVKAGPLAG